MSDEDNIALHFNTTPDAFSKCAEIGDGMGILYIHLRKKFKFTNYDNITKNPAKIFAQKIKCIIQNFREKLLLLICG